MTLVSALTGAAHARAIITPANHVLHFDTRHPTDSFRIGRRRPLRLEAYRQSRTVRRTSGCPGDIKGRVQRQRIAGKLRDLPQVNTCVPTNTAIHSFRTTNLFFCALRPAERNCPPILSDPGKQIHRQAGLWFSTPLSKGQLAARPGIAFKLMLRA